MKIKTLFYCQFWRDLHHKIKCLFNPRQEWLTDVIPDTYCDKAELIPRLLFKCLEHYVEVERQQPHVRSFGYAWEEELEKGYISQEEVDRYQKVDKDLIKAYSWIKNGRRNIDKQIDEAYPETNFDEIFLKTEDGDYEMVSSDERKEAYKEVNRLEAIKLKKDIEAMQIIVKYHQRLWT
jgi:hypothetical protein